MLTTRQPVPRRFRSATERPEALRQGPEPSAPLGGGETAALMDRGTSGLADQPVPETDELVAADLGFTAASILAIADAPMARRISGTDASTMRGHMRNAWYMPSRRRPDIGYPTGLRRVTFDSTMPTGIELLREHGEDEVSEAVPAVPVPTLTPREALA